MRPFLLYRNHAFYCSISSAICHFWLQPAIKKMNKGISPDTYATSSYTTEAPHLQLKNHGQIKILSVITKSFETITSNKFEFVQRLFFSVFYKIESYHKQKYTYNYRKEIVLTIFVESCETAQKVIVCFSITKTITIMIKIQTIILYGKVFFMLSSAIL